MTVKALDFNEQPKLKALLLQGLAQLQLNYTEQQIQQWLSFLGELRKWNRVYNLTAITEPSAMVNQHLLDSLVIATYVQGTHCLDVGTGAGLPGIPLAILSPHQHWDLLDSQTKKIRFLTHVTHQLALANVKLIHERVEHYQCQTGYEVITARAFSSLNEFINKTQHLLAPGGKWLVMKGQLSGEECEQLSNDVKIVRVIPLEIPGMKATRHLVIVTKQQKQTSDHG